MSHRSFMSPSFPATIISYEILIFLEIKVIAADLPAFFGPVITGEQRR